MTVCRLRNVASRVHVGDHDHSYMSLPCILAAMIPRTSLTFQTCNFGIFFHPLLEVLEALCPYSAREAVCPQHHSGMLNLRPNWGLCYSFTLCKDIQRPINTAGDHSSGSPCLGIVLWFLREHFWRFCHVQVEVAKCLLKYCLGAPLHACLIVGNVLVDEGVGLAEHLLVCH